MPAKPRWWELRPAQNRKPATYTCPLCGELLPALSAHTLMFPEGDHARRRHAHTACVLRVRRRGELLTRDEWERGTRTHGAQETRERSSRRPSARMIRWALRPRLRRSRPSDS